MTPVQKGLLAGALLFAALFAGALLLGSRQEGRSSADRGFASNYRPPSWLKKPGKLFAPPRIALPGPTVSVSPAVPFTFKVGASDTSFRTARLRLQQGTMVAIDYADDTEGGSSELRNQSVTLPREGAGDRMETTIIAMRQGGRLSMRCLDRAPCVLAIE